MVGVAYNWVCSTLLLAALLVVANVIISTRRVVARDKSPSPIGTVSTVTTKERGLGAWVDKMCVDREKKDVNCELQLLKDKVVVTRSSVWKTVELPEHAPAGAKCVTNGSRTVCVTEHVVWEYDVRDNSEVQQNITAIREQRLNITHFDEVGYTRTAMILRVKAVTNNMEHFFRTKVLDFWDDECSREYVGCGEPSSIGDTLYCDAVFAGGLSDIQYNTDDYYHGGGAKGVWVTRGHITKHSQPAAEEISDFSMNYPVAGTEYFIYTKSFATVEGSLRIYPRQGTCAVAEVSFPVGGVSWNCDPPPSECTLTVHGYACTAGGWFNEFKFRYYVVSDQE